MLIDTHAHLNFSAYKKDFEEVIGRSLNNDIWIINVGSQYDTSKRAVEIAQKYQQGVYAAVGLHPIHLETHLVKIKTDPEEIQEFWSHEEEFNYEKYKELAGSQRIVAIGEIGLDYYYKPKTKRKLEFFKEKQRTGLCQQLELAGELNLPVIFHCRMAHDDLINVLSSYQNSPHVNKFTMVKRFTFTLRGVIHCFTGNWEQAEKYLEMGFYLGFNGLIFKLDFDEIIKKTPLERILIETDCPYLTPLLPAEALAKTEPKLGRNEPIYLRYILEKIAKLKNLNLKEMAEITTKNAKELFKI